VTGAAVTGGRAPLAGFDHVGVLVRDLDAAAARLEALGFRLTAPAAHAAEGGRPGSVQRSLMLRSGYLEIQAIADIDGPHPLAPAARRFFGAHILAFGVDEPEAARRTVLARGLPVGDVLRWSRPVAESGAEARFSFFAAAYDPADGAFLCWVRQETPDVVRPPALLDHPNGVLALDGVVIATDGPPGRLIDRLAACGGIPDGRGGVRLRGGRVVVAGRAALPAAVAQAAWPADPFVAILTATATDPDDVVGRAMAAGVAAGVAVGRDDDARLLDLRADLGCWIAVRPPD
jgi:catechol 2,3-dioxygenase-like lactoylglutathione lyase family enzyme